MKKARAKRLSRLTQQEATKAKTTKQTYSIQPVVTKAKTQATCLVRWLLLRILIRSRIATRRIDVI